MDGARKAHVIRVLCVPLLRQPSKHSFTKHLLFHLLVNCHPAIGSPPPTPPPQLLGAYKRELPVCPQVSYSQENPMYPCIITWVL